MAGAAKGQNAINKVTAYEDGRPNYVPNDKENSEGVGPVVLTKVDGQDAAAYLKVA